MSFGQTTSTVSWIDSKQRRLSKRKMRDLTRFANLLHSRPPSRPPSRKEATACSQGHLPTKKAELDNEGRGWRHEARSGWLRLIVLLILATKIVVWEYGSVNLIHVLVVAAYGLATFVALGLALARRGSIILPAVFAAIDAMLVVALFHEHLFAPENTFEHRLSAPTLAIGFLLLAHVALRLKPRLVILFAGIVVTGWLSLLIVSIIASSWEGVPHRHDWSALPAELALGGAFGFSALVCYLLTRDHSVLLAEAVDSEKHRRNLARFFSPSALSELEIKGTSLKLSHQRAAVMFIDLRSFSTLSEMIDPEEIAAILAEYRQLVTQAVFAHDGTVDKFIGDGVMAVFGQPNATASDTARALRCALNISASLAEWKQTRLREGKTAMDAGIGLHVGPVIGGVLRSGTHDELTVIGDTVNIAERLERLSKTLDAAIIVSKAVLSERPSFTDGLQWAWRGGVELDGRSGTLDIAYLPRSKSELAA